jgi:hypothetical protein
MMRNLPSTEKPYHRILAVLLAFFSFAMSAYLSDAVFERLPHLEDEMAYLYEARIIAGGNLVIDTPEPRLAYWQPFVVDQAGNRFGKYTPGWPALLAVGVLLGQEWAINAFFAALTVALVYRLGRAVDSPDAGVFAAALTAFSPMMLLLNGTLMGHTTALFSTVLFIYAYWRIEHGSHRLQWGIVAGVALGLLITNRPLTGVAVAAPFVAWGGVKLVRALLPHTLTSSPNSGRGNSAELSSSDGVGARHALPLQTNPETSKTDVGTTHESSLQKTGEASSTDVGAQHAAPLHSSLRSGRSNDFLTVLKPFIALGVVAIVLSLSIPLLNYQAVGNPSQNLYTLVWPYDRVGYGEGYGRSGHTLEKGVRHMRFDLSLMAADLFGWQLQPLTSSNVAPGTPVNVQLTTEADYWDFTGISWILLPFGLIVAFRKKSLLVAIWLAVGLALLAIPFQTGDINHIRDPQIAWIIVIGLMVWLCAPFLVLRDQTGVWTWLLASIALSLVIVHLIYWIGSQRYSTRYYFEALPALALISALPLAWLANRRISGIRPIVYLLFSGVLFYSLFFYSLPRIFVLNGFNLIDRQIIEAVEERREGDRPVLVIVTGDNVRWRSYGALMALTSPYLDSEIVAARASSSVPREEILARFPGRQIIDMLAEENNSWFADEAAPAVG